MPLTKQQKQKVIEDLQDKVERQKSMVFFDFTGLKVKDLTQLRKRMKVSGSEIKVAKKTLLALALKNIGLGDRVKELKGEVALAFGFKDDIVPVKTVYQFSQEHANLKILGGFFEGMWRGVEDMAALAQLPGKEQLLARLVGSISAPIANLAYSLQYNLKGLVYTLSLIKK